MTKEQFQGHCKKYFERAEAAKNRVRQNTGVDSQLSNAYQRVRREDGIEFNDEWFESHQFKPLPEDDDFAIKSSFIAGGDPLDIIDKLHSFVKKTYD